MTWHVQIAGNGPTVLLVHGTGASTHSWRDLLPLLATTFTVIAPDLPGHAFTGTPPAARLSLPGMAASLTQLLRVLEIQPRVAVGHSAGAAILAQMCLDRAIDPAGLISLNGALLPIGGLAGRVFSPLAKVMAQGTAVPGLVARWADDAAVIDRLIGQTGSTLDATGLALYRRLAGDPRHAGGALGMMAHWDLRTLQARLPSLTTPLVLVVGSRDRSISPEDAFRVRSLVPGSKVETLRGLGHLAHEEQPREVAAKIVQHAAMWGAVARPTPSS